MEWQAAGGGFCQWQHSTAGGQPGAAQGRGGTGRVLGAFAQRQPEDNAANFHQLFAWHAEGKLKPLVSQTYPLEEAGAAIEKLGQRQAVGKLVVLAR
ncbi:zinc-binding dehydrogenase [Pseudomonas putida]|uniref:zinc-binding dehydrogenase n=1 Tax=Pseudomonas putida TaxID=303 RepID=UPI0021AB0FC1|nr:zinc-binding dehydrogenase [Pseudomonas putida]